MFIGTINRTFLSWLFAIILGEKMKYIPRGTHDWKLFVTPKELDQEAHSAGLERVSLQGEFPEILSTLWRGSIDLRCSRSRSVAYSALYKQKSVS